jgi:quercetin dioxygenase-like cupin family protein
MATHHALPGEIVDQKTWARDLPDEKTKVIVKTGYMEFIRLVLPAGKDIASHKVNGPIVIQRISGEIEVTAMGCAFTCAGTVAALAS